MCNDNRYTAVEYEGLGHYVSSINGVYEDVARQLSWVLLKRTSEGDCRLDVGWYLCYQYLP